MPERDWTAVDDACKDLRAALERKEELRAEVITTLEDRVIENVQTAALGHVVFSAVRWARPGGHDLIDFVRYLKFHLRDVPEPAAIRPLF